MPNPPPPAPNPWEVYLNDVEDELVTNLEVGPGNLTEILTELYPSEEFPAYETTARYGDLLDAAIGAIGAVGDTLTDKLLDLFPELNFPPVPPP